MSASTNKTAGTTAPIQVLPWAQKTDDWFKENIDHKISIAGLTALSTDSFKDLDLLYDVYNNRFPSDWFKHITDPLSAKNNNHKAFPARIRPTGILRTNIDLLLGEFPRRPFIYNVVNRGETGYNSFVEGMQKKAQETLTQHFLQAALQEAQASGQELSEEQLQQLQQAPPVPEDVKAEFTSSFKDLKAIKAQKWLNRLVREREVKRKLLKMFKHWLIAGSVISYKAIENDEIVYRDISPKNFRGDKSSGEEYYEDGEWAVCVDMLTVSDIVDRFYQDLEAEQLRKIEEVPKYGTPQGFYQHLAKLTTEDQGKIPVYHVQWKGKKKMGFLSYLDPETFQLVEEPVDEDYVLDKERGDKVDWRWVNEVYEGWRIGDDIHLRMRPVPVQRNAMNNFSRCKLSYNGRNYSDLHSENISVLQIGIPFQILYIIVGYIIEKTIAKSKGKILLIDKKAIPDEGDWDEEKFFYYSEALGYGLLDRSQPGVDKTWNQYQVLDMSMFDQIKQLIEIQQHLKQEWDDIIGITRQRKGQTYASDGQGVNERSVFQSTVITDMIFSGFEDFEERELQGLLDLSKFIAAKGIRGTWNTDAMSTEIMEIAPEDFMEEEFGVMIERAAEEIRKLEAMRGQVQAMLQNNHKASTILEVLKAENIAELTQTLRKIEAIDAELQQQQAKSEQDAEAAADQRKQQYAKYDSLLRREEQGEKYDREEDLIMLEASLEHAAPEEPTEDTSGTDAVKAQESAAKMALAKQKVLLDHVAKREAGKLQKDALALEKRRLEEDLKQRTIDNGFKKQKLTIDRKKAAQKPKPAAKKK